MNLVAIVLGIIFALFSSVVLAYVSMATGAGPWIAPTLVLIASLILKLRRVKKNQQEVNEELTLIQAAGSVGGIVAVGIGFTFPMLYFLNKDLFNSWLSSPFWFISIMAFLCIGAGGLGIFLARLFSDKLIVKEKLGFPVSHLIYRMITSQSQTNQAKNMLIGFFSTGFFCFFRDGFMRIGGFLPKDLNLFSLLGDKFSIALYLGPTLWAVGFITGAVITIPLLVGMFSKYLVLYPLNQHATYLPWKLFDPMDNEGFTMAFCAGLGVVEAIFGISKYPKIIWNSIKAYFGNGRDFFRGMYKNIRNGDFKLNKEKILKQKDEVEISNGNGTKRVTDTPWFRIEAVLVVIGAIAVMTYFNFGTMSQVCFFIFTIIATYQISWMGAKIGLIPFGRFATFVMLPMMFIFTLDNIQLTILCVFFNICAAVASDLLFDYKVGELCKVNWNKIHRYQWLGLVATSLGMGVFFWLIFSNFQLGSTDLFAYRAMARALLIKSLSFNLWVVGMGMLYGLLIKQFKVSPMLILCGILMPNNLSIGLIIGGLISLFIVKVRKEDPEKYSFFWSGVFASEALWILIGICIKLVGA